MSAPAPASPQPSVTDTIAGFALLVAIIQPWAIEAWKKWGLFGAVDVHSSPHVVLGYGVVGPSMQMRMTMTALNKTFHVTAIDAVLRRQTDGATHNLSWRFSFTGTSSSELEESISFTLTDGTDKVLTAVLVDDAVADKVRLHSQELTSAFQSFLQARVGVAEIDADLQASLLAEFQTTQPFLTAYGRIERLTIWQADAYTILLRVHTVRPSKVFPATFSFVLSDESAEQLRQNATPIALTALGESNQYWPTASPEITKVS